MKTIVTFVAALIFLIFGCNTKRPEPTFYRNSFTKEVFSKKEFTDFYKKLYLGYPDSTRKKINVRLYFSKLVISADSIVQPFTYDVQLGNRYIKRATSYKKIGTNLSPQKFVTVNGDNIYIGGKQKKPIFINLWFINCPGCIAEMPALNRLQEKYSDKVDFVGMTFESNTDVLKFLKRNKFIFKNIANSDNYIQKISTSPYPENIFINKSGTIEYVEGGLSDDKNLDLVIAHFESIIKDLLRE